MVLQAQHERASNSFLRMENDKIRCENVTMREALKNVICPNCVGQPVTDYFDAQKLRMENTQLKEEVIAMVLTTAGHVVSGDVLTSSSSSIYLCVCVCVYVRL
jgi:homeobox-leucine zipper protein